MAYRELNDVNRGRLVGMMEAGLTQSDVSRRLNIDRSTVRYWWHRWQTEGNVDRIERSGRPSKLTIRMKRTIRTALQKNPWQTYGRIKQENQCLNHVSRKTINRCALQMKYHARRPVQRIPLGIFHRKNRLNWCKERIDMTVDDWMKIAFSDESRFTLDFNDGRLLVRRLTGLRFQDNMIGQHDRYGRGSTMVWGAISFNSRSQLVVIKGNLTSQRYVTEILQTIAVPFLCKVDPDDPPLIFQQDNARPHSATFTTQYLVDNHIATLVWPARSPDLSIIEHVWDILGRRLQSEYTNPPYSLDILSQRLIDQWNLIPQMDIQNLYRSMSRRLSECIQARGGHTRY